MAGLSTLWMCEPQPGGCSVEQNFITILHMFLHFLITKVEEMPASKCLPVLWSHGNKRLHPHLYQAFFSCCIMLCSAVFSICPSSPLPSSHHGVLAFSLPLSTCLVSPSVWFSTSLSVPPPPAVSCPPVSDTQCQVKYITCNHQQWWDDAWFCLLGRSTGVIQVSEIWWKDECQESRFFWCTSLKNYLQGRAGVTQMCHQALALCAVHSELYGTAVQHIFFCCS